MSVIVFLLVIIPFIGFPLLTLLVTCREKRYVWFFEKQGQRTELASPAAEESNPYVPPTTLDEGLPVSDFALRSGSELDAMGFQFLGDYRHAKGGIYKIRYDAWVSSDRLVLAWIEAGSVSAIRVQNLTMVSYGYPREQSHANDTLSIKVIDSFTNESCYAPDLAGGTESMVFPSASATKLQALHRERLKLVEPQAFSEDPMGDFHQLRRQEASEVCSLGMGRFVDSKENVWLPTLLGGVKMTASMYAFMLGRRFYPHQFRLKRRVKKAARASNAVATS